MSKVVCEAYLKKQGSNEQTYLRKFEAASMNTVYDQYNTYCKGKGYTEMVKDSDSHGEFGWSNGEDSIILKFV